MKLRLITICTVLALLALGSCRTAGPGTPARTVAAFFNKYEGRPGFKTTDWSAGLTTRLLLSKLGKFGGDNDLSQALTSIRSFRIITFTPASASSQKLVAEGLTKEVDGLLQNERYTALAESGGSTTMRYATRQSGDKVQEIAASGHVDGAPDSFVLASISGNFTREQVTALTKFLPGVISETTK
ncbi:DUF4252 domain-containing protein [Hymenobacter jejuensis]|uniref:DUF4252 domain-containing protein n=1 Tax=Hymenobacter jejuensis TaxID=2502781 RepID=A0A5B8A483_9BACT|nr:DUF4252 domain-containing protein [Hymenobacter jejuensis]QDA60942.1 DUF4252 domain-containing protein [Hymenobacter jejuensis]